MSNILIPVHEQKRIEQEACDKLIKQMLRTIRNQQVHNDPEMKYILKNFSRDQLFDIYDFVKSFS